MNYRHSDDEIIALVTDAFAEVARPEHFTDHMHCDECREHDQLLLNRDLKSLSIQDVGSAAWNPITMATPHGFAYYLPALARLALEPPPVGHDWYGYLILAQLQWDGARNERWLFCTPRQRAAVAALLNHLFEARTEAIELYDCLHDLTEAIEIWSEAGKP